MHPCRLLIPHKDPGQSLLVFNGPFSQSTVQVRDTFGYVSVPYFLLSGTAEAFFCPALVQPAAKKSLPRHFLHQSPKRLCGQLFRTFVYGFSFFLHFSFIPCVLYSTNRANFWRPLGISAEGF